MSCPATSTRPCWIGSMPAVEHRVVVLPAPWGARQSGVLLGDSFSVMFQVFAGLLSVGAKSGVFPVVEKYTCCQLGTDL